MDRGAKRKAAAAASPDLDSRAPKGPKLSKQDVTPAETARLTAEAGLKFVEALKQARDKSGRLIATNFLTLPDKKQFPQYYQFIKLPIAIDTVEEQLKRHEYPNLSAVEADMKRLINNAKAFNEKPSEIYSDAERVRKMLSNYMTKNNPAYSDPNYVSLPTPLPDEAPQRSSSMARSGDGGSSGTTLKLRMAEDTPVLQVKRQQSEIAVAADTPTPSAESGDFEGKTFQEAQDQILTELIKYKDDEQVTTSPPIPLGLEIFMPFVHLPPRSLTDYYATIKHLVCLKSVQKRVRGIHGRTTPTGTTDFKSWDAFEEEVSYVWRNAREYNEDGSDIFNLAGELEEHFHRRLKAAQSVVEEPPQPTLKLKMPTAKPAIKLRLGQKGSPAPTPPSVQGRATPGVTVDNAALQRQRDLVNAGINGTYPANQPTTRNPYLGQHADPMPTASRLPSDGRSGSAQSPPRPLPNIKSDTYPSRSPALNNIRLHGEHHQLHASGAGRSSNFPAPLQAVMPPPSTTPRPPSGSPLPTFQAPVQAPYHAPYYQPPPPSDIFQKKLRPPWQDVFDALIQSLTLRTHPGLTIATTSPFHLTIPAHKTLCQQSVTVTLPPAHYYLQLAPKLHPSLATSSSSAVTTSTGPERQYRIFVTANGQRVHPKPATPAPLPAAAPAKSPPAGTKEQVNGHVGTSGASNSRNGVSGSEEKHTGLIYEVRLLPGVNRVSVEILAAAEIGRGKEAAKGVANGVGGGGAGIGVGAKAPEVEFEKVTAFVNLLKG